MASNYDAKRVARLLDTNGKIYLTKTTTTNCVRVCIYGLSETEANAIMEWAKSGRIKKQNGGSFYQYQVEAELAIVLLNKLFDCSVWQKRQIECSKRYQELKNDIKHTGTSMGVGHSERQYGNELVLYMDKVNAQLNDKQKQYRDKRNGVHANG